MDDEAWAMWEAHRARPRASAADRRAAKDETEQLWIRYVNERDEQTESMLFGRYLPFVRFQAHELSKRLPPSVTPDELLSAGSIGLLMAMRKYDPRRSTKFISFCMRRVVGEMLEVTRTGDPCPRELRRQSRLFQKVVDGLRAQLGREPDDEDLAGHLRLAPSEVRLRREKYRAPYCCSLDEALAGNAGGREQARLVMLPDGRQEDPSLPLEREDIRRVATDGLPKREKTIVELHGLEQRPMKEVARILGLSESRISQLWKYSILPHLRRVFRRRFGVA